ncbi:MAG: glycoside hydrolase family 2, partial [Bacteroidetes bacterium]|nr:glycoside hydrolase family 2 [Bacteroidota bacterium]
NSLYLARRGEMGRDEFLALRPLGFHPVAGAWYAFRIATTGDRIRVWLGDEKIPRIDITDKNSRLLPSGQVILGGGWLTAEYENLKITPTSNITTASSISTLPAADKERQRSTERAAYSPLRLTTLTGPRTELSLDGRWLFYPTYEGISDKNAVSNKTNDDTWHFMPVPSFWNPIRIWLHGETFGPHAKGASDNYFQQETDRCEGYTFDYKKTSQAWYRQWVELPAAIKGRSCELAFDAVSKVAEVYINGKKAGSHVGMFGDFRVDGTGLFVPGKNLIAVKVSRDYGKSIADADKIVDVAVSVPVTNKMVHDLPHGFYGGDPAGIWQPVKLIITNPIRITDVFIKPSLTGATIDVTINNTTSRQTGLNLKTSIPGLYDNTQPVTVPAATEKTITLTITDLHPKLWSPQAPNLYNFTFRLLAAASHANIPAGTTTQSTPIDQITVTSGFRTFESRDGYFWLNGRKYWLRGANQTPFALEPDSPAIADHFFQLMKSANMEITRTHTSPYNETWMDAADRNGIGISYEGTWPWLMLAGSMPDSSLISLWADEFIGLLKKYRNHPSLLLWTVNNEMKFYDNDPDPARARVKMRIISEVVKRMRRTDPTRPICFDSNYRRNTKKFGPDFFNTIDDGDVDDVHAYYNWYDYSIFRQFKGEFQTQYHNEGRPLISQEMSTGYPNAETGHATRFYTIVHQTPQSLIGDLAYENADPAWFLRTHAFITGELAEAFRRSDPKASGFLHFALITWFRNVYDRKTIEPYPVYYAMKRALQPVLVSAELWGRHFYAGRPLPARICIVNDATDGKPLPPSTLEWQLTDSSGHTITSGRLDVPATPYYGRQWLTPEITIPRDLPNPRTDARLVLTLRQDNKNISSNQYDITLATRQWAAPTTTTTPVLVDFTGIHTAFDSLGIPYTKTTLDEALTKHTGVFVLSGLKPDTNCTTQQLAKLKTLITGGARVLLLDAPAAAQQLYPQNIRGWIIPTEGEIANMEVPESPVFNGIEPLDLRYFNDNRREMPSVCHAALQLQPGPHTQALATQQKIHGYVEGDMEKRAAFMEKIKGFPIVKIDDGGTLLVSTMATDKASTDPIAGRLLYNMIRTLTPDNHPSHSGTSKTPRITPPPHPPPPPHTPHLPLHKSKPH